ncbi:MAG TPA: two-component regulator propeller domain-containing protein, partial [Chitinophagaceae bacterium]|nr:two-component regulator propeller domain-containing protein [Chitinophagaceae bacterium]
MTIDNGLSDNSVTSIVQDENGFIWIGTENGLNRYDGSQFEKFFRGDKPTELPGNHITKLVKLQGNYLGIATDKGAAIFNTRTNECKRLVIPSQKEMELFTNEIYYAIANTEDELIISTRTGVFVFNDKAKLIAKLEAGYTINDTKTKGIGFAARSVLLNHDTTLINTDKGIAFYDSKSKNINYLKYSKNLFHRHIGYLLDGIPPYSIGSANKNLLFFLPNYTYEDTLSVIDFDKQIIKHISLPAGFNAEFGWESTFSFVNDSTFLLNSSTNGYFVLHYLPS